VHLRYVAVQQFPSSHAAAAPTAISLCSLTCFINWPSRCASALYCSAAISFRTCSSTGCHFLVLPHLLHQLAQRLCMFAMFQCSNFIPHMQQYWLPCKQYTDRLVTCGSSHHLRWYEHPSPFCAPHLLHQLAQSASLHVLLSATLLVALRQFLLCTPHLYLFLMSFHAVCCCCAHR
jgi:hypothetical protein